MGKKTELKCAKSFTLRLRNSFHFFGRVPSLALRVGVLRATLSLRCYALLTHPPHASRKPLLDALPYF
ncbi:MAG: hypothetical protein NZ455_01795 [Bacteroidia bacterium]|nr:hypothetical protein [Bacteroidia bacterium]MDW8347670.1 hypothetical protein [Bacteroidia bacterium]